MYIQFKQTTISCAKKYFDKQNISHTFYSVKNKC